MKKWILFFVMLLVCPVSFATPPFDLTLTYDLLNGTLTAQGHHPTQDRFEHYIRRMEVTINDGEAQEFYFTRQDSVSEFKQTVSVQTKPSDQIHIKVYCSQGGTREAELVIPAAKKDASGSTTDLKERRDQEHKNLQIVP